MINFRYHIVSIVSVFLALAIGVALGGGPLKGEVDNTLVQQVKNDRATKTSLEQQINGLKSGNSFTDEFAKTVAPGLLGNSLQGRAVTMPGAVPNTSTYALTNATLPYAVALADKGWQQALRDDRSLALGLNTHAGRLTYAPVADAHGLESVSLEDALG